MIVVTLFGLMALGLILGSFCNALVWRFHAQDEVLEEIEELREQKPGKGRDNKIADAKHRLAMLSMSKGRSMCSKCSHPLAPNDLIPLFSWLWLKGKCRYCRQKIEDTPLLEAGLPVVFVLSYLFWPLDLQGYGLLAFVFWLIFATGFAALTAYDIRWYLLPDRIVWPLVFLAVVQVLLHTTVFDGGMAVIATAFWGVATASGIFWFLYLLSRGRWIGFGDVKLGIVLGLLVGGPLQGLMVIFLASVLGSLASVPLLFRKRLERTSIIPFGPFLILAASILVLFGQRFVDFFNSFILQV